MSARKGITAVLAVVALLGAILAIVPFFIDWNHYRTPLARQLSDALGREVSLDGPVLVSFLPLPYISAKDVKISKDESAALSSQAMIETIDVGLTFSALFSGGLDVTSITLRQPVITVEKMAGNSARLFFEDGLISGFFGSSAKGDGAFESGVKGTGASFSEISVRGGILHVLAPDSPIERIEQINADLLFENGRKNWSGVGVIRTVPVAFSGQVDAPNAEGNRLVVASFGLANKSGQVEIKGEIDSEKRFFFGTVSAIAGDLARLLRDVNVRDRFAPAARLAGGGQLFVSKDGLAITDLRIDLADQAVEGMARYEAGGASSFSVVLSGRTFDADRILALIPKSEKMDGESSVIRALPISAVRKNAVIPANLHGRFDLHIDAISLNGAVLENGRFSVDVEGSEVLINQATVGLPGETDLSLFGFIVNKDGVLSLEGAFEAASRDLRGLIGWANYDISAIAADQLQKAHLYGDLRLGADGLFLDGVEMDLDGQKVEGAFSFEKGGERPRISLMFGTQRLNADAYQPAEPGRGAITAGGRPGSNDPLNIASMAQKSVQSWGAEADIELRGRVAELILRGRSIQGVVFSAKISDDRIDLGELSIADFEGANLRLRGGLLLKSVAFDNFQYEIRAEEPVHFLTALGISSGFDIAPFGDLAAGGVLNGAMESIDATLRAEVAGGVISAVGSVKGLPGAPNYTASIETSHADLGQLIHLFAPDYKPNGTLGAFAGSMQARGDGETTSLSDLRLRLGPVTTAGWAFIKRTPTGKPYVDMALTADYLPLDLLLPTFKTAALPPSDEIRIKGGGGLAPILAFIPADRAFSLAAAARRPEPPAPSAAPRPKVEQMDITPKWSTTPLPLSWFGALDGALDLDARIIAFGDVKIYQSKLKLELKDQRLALKQMDGQLYGGALKAEGNISDAGDLAFSVALDDARIQEILPAMAGLDFADGLGGGEMSVTARGGSMQDLVSSLSGNGSVTVTEGVLKGVNLAAISDLCRSGKAQKGIIALGEAARGGSTKFSYFGGPVSFSNGIVEADNLEMIAEGGGGNVKAAINLAISTIDLNAGFYVSDKTMKSPPLGVRISGPISNPRRFVDINEIQAWLLKQ